MRTTIDRAGRVVIPKEIRQRAGLTPGTELDIRFDHGAVEIRPPRPNGHVVEDGGHLFWQPAAGSQPITVDDVNEAIEDVRGERESEIFKGDDLEDRTGF